MTRILAGSRRRLVTASRSDDSDRAVGPFQDATADGAKHHACEPATSARSHDEQAGAMGLFEELDDGVTPDDVAADGDIGILLRPAGQQLGDQGLFLAGDLGPVADPWLAQADTCLLYTSPSPPD